MPHNDATALQKQHDKRTVGGSRKTLTQKRIALGDSIPTRDFLYADDVIAALVKAAVIDGIERQIFNIGTGHNWNVVVRVGDEENLVSSGNHL